MSDACDYQMKCLIANQGFYRFQVELKHADEEIDDASRNNIKKLEKDGAELVKKHSANLNELIGKLKKHNPQ